VPTSTIPPPPVYQVKITPSPTPEPTPAPTLVPLPPQATPPPPAPGHDYVPGIMAFAGFNVLAAALYAGVGYLFFRR